MSRLFQILFVLFALSALVFGASALRSDSDVDADTDVDVDVDVDVEAGVESEVSVEAEAGAEAESEVAAQAETAVDAEAGVESEMGVSALATLSAEIAAYSEQLVEEHGVSAALISSLMEADPASDKEFAGYHSVYNKAQRYKKGSPEYKKRAEVYALNKAKRITHNAAAKAKRVSYKVCVNKFSDVLPTEMTSHKGAKSSKDFVVETRKRQRSEKSAKMDALLVSDQDWEVKYVCAQFPSRKCSDIRSLIKEAKKTLNTDLRSKIMDFIMKKYNRSRDAKFISSEKWEIEYVAQQFPNYSVAQVSAAITKAKKQTGNNSREDIMVVLKRLLPGRNKAADDNLISSQEWEVQYVAKQFPKQTFESVKGEIIVCKKKLNSNKREKIMACLYEHYRVSMAMDRILISMQDWEVRYVAKSFPTRSVAEVRRALEDAKKTLNTDLRAPIMEFLTKRFSATAKLIQLSNRIKAAAVPATPIKLSEAQGSGPGAGRFSPKDEKSWCQASRFQMDQDIVSVNTDVWPPVVGKPLTVNVTVSNPNTITKGKLVVQLVAGSESGSYSDSNNLFKVLSTATTGYTDGLNAGRSINEFNQKGPQRKYANGFSDYAPSVYSVFITIDVPSAAAVPSFYKTFLRAAIAVDFSDRDGPADKIAQGYCYVSAAATISGSTDKTPAPAPAPLPAVGCSDVESNCAAKIKEFTCNGKDESTKAFMTANCAASCTVCVKDPVAPKPVTTKGFSWVEKGMVLDARDQQRCMSCWAFAAAGALESNYAIAAGLPKPVAVSEENMLTCMSKSQQSGCNEGNWVYKAFQFAAEKGVSSLADVAWTTKTKRPDTCPAKQADGRCPYPDINKCTSGKSIFGAGSKVRMSPGSSAYRMISANEKAFIAALEQGPIAVVFDATDASFQTYKSGVFDPPAQRAPSYKMHYDHAVLAVAWGETDGKVWVLCRNSWGPQWGDKGFFKVAIDAVGIIQQATQPIIRRA